MTMNRLTGSTPVGEPTSLAADYERVRRAAEQIRRLRGRVIPLHLKCPAALYFEEGGRRRKGWDVFKQRPMGDREFDLNFGERNGADGYGVLTGRNPFGPSVYACDFDDEDAYHSWAEENPSLVDALPTVRSGRGYHVYAALPEDVPAFYHKLKELGWKGDVIANGGYLCGPGSLHGSGRLYEFVNRPPLHLRP